METLNEDNKHILVKIFKDFIRRDSHEFTISLKKFPKKEKIMILNYPELSKKYFIDISFLDNFEKYFDRVRHEYLFDYELDKYGDNVFIFGIKITNNILGNYDFSNSNITDDDLGLYENIMCIDLSDCKNITNKGLVHLKNARKINLANTNITDVTHLQNAFSIDLSGTEIDNTVIEKLSKHKELACLKINNCNNLTDDCVEYLKDIPIVEFEKCENISEKIHFEHFMNNFKADSKFAGGLSIKKTKENKVICIDYQSLYPNHEKKYSGELSEEEFDDRIKYLSGGDSFPTFRSDWYGMNNYFRSSSGHYHFTEYVETPEGNNRGLPKREDVLNMMSDVGDLVYSEDQ